MTYNFYVAQVVSTSTMDDNRIQVRVLPQMEGIDSNDCPIWPSFFKDSMYMGKTGDYVWVICDDEFSLGYVFGLANYNTYSDRTLSDGKNLYKTSTDGISLSIPSSLRENISKSSESVDATAISLENAKVTYWDTNCIHFVERNTGGKVIAYNNGTLYIFRSDECLLKIGDNIIKIMSDGISLSGSKIKIDSQYVGLGHNAQNNVMTNDAKSSEGAITSKFVFA